MNDTKNKGSKSILLVALLELLQIDEDKEFNEQLDNFKTLLKKLDHTSSYNVLRLKMRKLLSRRDEVLLANRCAVAPPTLQAKKQESLEVPVTDLLERTLNLLEGTNKTSDDFSGKLKASISEIESAHVIDDVRVVSRQVISATNDMVAASDSFHFNIGEVAHVILDYQRKIEELEGELQQQKEIALIDTLTGAHNRRAFDIRLDELVAQSRRFNTNLCLFLVDMDHFKDINDTHGHQVGDDVLVNFVALLKESTREYDMVFRFGGDEFAVLFPNENLEQGHNFVARMQTFMSNNSYRYKDIKFHMSISGGLVELKSDDDRETLFKRADDLLYKAKRKGRGRVCSPKTTLVAEPKVNPA